MYNNKNDVDGIPYGISLFTYIVANAHDSDNTLIGMNAKAKSLSYWLRKTAHRNRKAMRTLSKTRIEASMWKVFVTYIPSTLQSLIDKNACLLHDCGIVIRWIHYRGWNSRKRTGGGCSRRTSFSWWSVWNRQWLSRDYKLWW